MPREAMHVEIVSYTTTISRSTQAYVSIVIDGYIRINGLHYRRNGTLDAAQLTCSATRPTLICFPSNRPVSRTG
jgi:hypothetical protein